MRHSFLMNAPAGVGGRTRMAEKPTLGARDLWMTLVLIAVGIPFPFQKT